MKIILFNGPPRSGKDTSVTIFREILRINNIASISFPFAKNLKLAIHSLFEISGGLRHFEDSKNEQSEELLGFTPRELYIWLSEEVIKPKFGKDFFAKIATKYIKTLRKDITVVISDCGFKEEVETLINEFGQENIIIVQTMRDGTSFESDSRSYIADMGCREFEISNNGSLADLGKKLEAIFRDLKL